MRLHVSHTDGAWARITIMAQKMPVLPAGRRALREAEPWSQAFLGTRARPRRTGWQPCPARSPWHRQPSPQPWQVVLLLPESQGNLSLRSQLHGATRFCCAGCSISSISRCSDGAAAHGAPTSPLRPAARPVLASSSLTALQPLCRMPGSPLNSPSPAHPLPVVLRAVSTRPRAGAQLGLPTGSLPLAGALLVGGSGPTRTRVLPPGPQPRPLWPGAMS